MRLRTLCLVWLAPAMATARAAQVMIPEPAELEKIVWEVSRVREIPKDKVRDLKAELERVVLETVEGAPWAPFHGVYGRTQLVFFQDVSETFYALALAYPHLSAAAQAKVKAFLEKERAARNPLTANYNYGEGSLREHYVLTPGSKRLARQGHVRATNPSRVRLYRLWAYHYYTRTPVDARSAAAYVRALQGKWTNSSAYFYTSENDEAACRIALCRLVRMAGDEATARTLVPGALEAMRARLRFEDSARPVDDQNNSWHGLAERGGIFVVRSGNNTVRIPRWRNLTPEIGRLLALGAAADMERQNRYVDVTRPVGHMAWSPRQFEGENDNNQPHLALCLFQAKAYIMRRPGEELRYYADIPWCKADLYYIERLVATIRAYGKIDWLDVRRARR